MVYIVFYEAIWGKEGLLFVTIKRSDIERTLGLFNSRYVSINFTVENEMDSHRPFLDLMLTRNDKKIDID